LIDASVDIVTISRRLSHATPNVTLAIYAHLFPKSDDKAAPAINAALASFDNLGRSSVSNVLIGGEITTSMFLS
jgi:hypothetical protein